ncbi:hypothetical protein TNCV_2477501 [Trichonephila clavipes]|nr:hypothetical protein TNCV_2477501 [Trichonephila clavipes]
MSSVSSQIPTHLGAREREVRVSQDVTRACSQCGIFLLFPMELRIGTFLGNWYNFIVQYHVRGRPIAAMWHIIYQSRGTDSECHARMPDAIRSGIHASPTGKLRAGMGIKSITIDRWSIKTF